MAATIGRVPQSVDERPHAGTVGAFVKRHPVLTYYALVFAISWGGMLLVIGPSGFPGTPEQIERLWPLAISALLTGPPVAGLLVTGLVSGRAGFHELLARLLRWRVGARWYAVALLTMPLVMTAVGFALSLSSPEFLPAIVTTDDKASPLLLGTAVGLGGGFVEELGWTGFAIPRLRLRHGVLATGLIVGVLWAAWHLLQGLWFSGTYSGTLSLALYMSLSIFASVAQLTAYRVLMVWVYDQAESLLVAVLMHASYIATTLFILAPQAISGVPFLTWLFAWAAVLWILVLVLCLIVSNGPL